MSDFIVGTQNPRIRCNVKMTAKGLYQTDVTYETFDGIVPAEEIVQAIKSLEDALEKSGRKLAV
jgi:hypothetical protein